MKMTLSKHTQGVIAVETALTLSALVIILLFSLQVGRTLYWQQHFGYITDRLIKLLVLDIQSSNKLDSATFDEALSLIEDDMYHKDFSFGLTIHLLSDNRNHEQSFNLGSGCNITSDYAVKMEDLERVTAAEQNKIPTRYLLGLSLCAQPAGWILQSAIPGFMDLPIQRQSYYPINHNSI